MDKTIDVGTLPTHKEHIPDHCDDPVVPVWLRAHGKELSHIKLISLTEC